MILAGASCRALARSFIQAGFEPICFDLFSDFDLANQACTTQVHLAEWPWAILPHLKTLVGIPFVYTGGLENHAAFLRHVSQSHPFWGNHPDLYEPIRDPFILKQMLETLGLAFPDILPAGSLIPETPTWLLKPLKGSGGLGIRSAKPLSIVPDSHYAQRQIVGSDNSVSLMIGENGYEVLLWAKGLECRDLLGGSEFGYVGSHWTGGNPPLLLGQVPVLALAEFLSRTVGLRGLVGIDFRVDSQGKWHVLEVNPRYTASMELGETVPDQSYGKRHWACFQGRGGGEPEWKGQATITGKCPMTKAILYAKDQFTLNPCLSWSTVTRTFESMYNIELFDLPWPGTKVVKGAPILTIMEKGTRWLDLETRLRPIIADLINTLEQP